LAGKKTACKTNNKNQNKNKKTESRLEGWQKTKNKID